MKKLLGTGLSFCLLAVSGTFAATKTWDGQGASASWGDATNWNGNMLPAFDGTEVLSFGTGFVSGTTVTLDGDRSVLALYQNTANSITYNPGTPSTSKLILTGGSLTNTSAAYSQTHNEEVVLGASGSFDINAYNATYLVSMNGAISENTPGCSITKKGTGRTLALNASNTFSGGVVLSEGQLNVGHNQALGTGPFRINAATTVNPVGLRTVTNNVEFATSSTITFYGNGLTVASPGTVTLFSNVTLDLALAGMSDLLTFPNGIQESGTNRSLRLLNSRYLVLNGASTFTGPLTLGTSGGALGYIQAGGTLATTNVIIYGGFVRLNAHNPLGSGKINILGAAGLTFETPGGAVRRDLDNEIDWKGQVTGSANDFAVDFNHNGGTSTLIGDLTFVMSQAGTTGRAPRFWNGIQERGGSWGVRITTGGATRYLILSGTSTYSGATTISHAILQVTDDNALPTNTALSIAYTSVSDGVFDMNGKATRIGSLAGTGYVMLGGGTLTIGGSANTTYAGYITGAGGNAGSGSLTRDGTGVQRLTSNTNLNYTGTTKILGGTLQVDGTLSTATGKVEVSGGALCGTGRINRAVNVLEGGTIQAGLSTNVVGTLTVGTLGLSNNATVAWAVNELTNDVIEVTNNLVQADMVTVKVYNLGRAIQPGEQLALFRYTNSLTGFDASKWTIDLSASPVRTSARAATVGVSGKTVYLTGLQSPASPGTVLMIR